MGGMDLLSLPDAVELFYMAMETQDRFFEFWISATFAVIIACHLGSRTLTRGYSAIMAMMYTAFSVNMTSRWLLAQGAVTRYRAEMLTILEADTGSRLVDLARFLTFGTLIFGTICTLFFIWFTVKGRKVGRAAT
ncbi:MAG TPA: hypothetical protein DEF79_05530 [Gammaproteobacteria bacterium]|nr:hypothetical protein [Gammaproteobacteria bacterium]|tara:strand:- start:5181 stop:5585 length:405 start_codon:yes stop_codon:yes gene_type:complete